MSTKRLNDTIKDEVLKIENNLVSSGSCKKFYEYVRTKTTAKQDIPSLVSPDSGVVHRDYDKATLLNDYFTSSLSLDNNILPNFEVPSVEAKNLNISNVYFYETKISNKIGKLKNNSSPGFDGVPVTLLKNLKQSIIKPLS